MHGAGTQGARDHHPEVIDLDSDGDGDNDSDGDDDGRAGEEVEFVREVHRRVVPREATVAAPQLPLPPPPPPPPLPPPLVVVPHTLALLATLGVPQFAIDTPLTALGFHGPVPFRYGMPPPPPPPPFASIDDSSDSSDSDSDSEDDVVVVADRAGTHPAPRRPRESDGDGDVVEVAAAAAAAAAGEGSRAAEPKEEEEEEEEEGVVEILPKRARVPPSISPLPRAAECVCARAALADERCPVCLTPLGDVDTLVCAAACRHMFCWHCIDEWLSRCKKICPVCRRPLSKAALQRVRVVDTPPPPPPPPHEPVTLTD